MKKAKHVIHQDVPLWKIFITMSLTSIYAYKVPLLSEIWNNYKHEDFLEKPSKEKWKNAYLKKKFQSVFRVIE